MVDRAPKRTALHGVHAALGAKLVSYAGFEVPMSYRGGIAAEHRAVREGVGVFDVSHMGEFEIAGPDAVAFAQRVTSNDVATLAPGRAQYTAILTDRGTIVDDCILYRFDDRLMLVVNAANVLRDWAHLLARVDGADVRLRDVSDDVALLALQGPGAEPLLSELTEIDVCSLPYFHFVDGTVAGVPCVVSRTGYTGEDGFELCCPSEHAERLWRALAAPGAAEPCGLGARDTLRLEAGMPLYGNELDDSVTPYEAGIGFIVKLGKDSPFIGRAALERQQREGVGRRMVGFRVVDPRAVARPGHQVWLDGRVVERVRSGTVTPTLNAAIGTTYLPPAAATPGRQIEVDIRGKRVSAVVVKMPFVPHRTRR